MIAQQKWGKRKPKGLLHFELVESMHEHCDDFLASLSGGLYATQVWQPRREHGIGQTVKLWKPVSRTK